MNILVFLCLACTVFLGLIGQRSFKRPQNAAAMQQAIFSVWAFILIRSLYLFFSAPASPTNQTVGASACLAGLVLFLWARSQHHSEIPQRAFTEDAPEKLITSGPYSRIRHPIYSSYLLTLLGLIICMDDYLLAGGWGIAVACYWIAAKKEEILILDSMNGSAYRSYKQHSGRLFPWKFWVHLKVVE